MPDSENARRLMSLFAGHGGAHGTHGEPVLDGLKWAIKTTARTLREPVTLGLWEQHLEGTRPLGVIPIKEDSTCSWGSIDIDIYDDDLLGVVERVQAAKLPLVPCRSKSGGLHLFLFLAEPQPAGEVRTYLKDVAARLGIAKKANGTTDTEIFPVQSEVLTERRDVGNWMVMPYFGSTYGGKLREQAGVKKTGAEQTIGEFLNLAESLRLDAEAFRRALTTSLPPATPPRRVNGSAQVKPFADGCVCLEHMVSDGRLTDGRKRTLFMMGLYYKRADPANWKRRVEEANGLFFEPPLPSEEVTGVHRQLSKKDYEYKCKEEPMSQHCDAKRCRLRRYGVGRGELFPTITGLSRLDTDPPIWFLDVDDRRYEASTDQLLDYRAMMKLFATSGNRVFRLMQPKDWVDALIEPMENLTIIEMPSDVGPGAQFTEVMEGWLMDRYRGQSREDLLRGKPWEENGRHYFRMEFLLKHMEKEGLKWGASARANATNLIRKMGGAHHQFTIKGRNIQVWWLPSDLFQGTPELDTPKPKEEMI